MIKIVGSMQEAVGRKDGLRALGIVLRESGKEKVGIKQEAV